VAAAWTQEHLHELPLANHAFGIGSVDVELS